jgi:hypothetical protein
MDMQDYTTLLGAFGLLISTGLHVAAIVQSGHAARSFAIMEPYKDDDGPRGVEAKRLIAQSDTRMMLAVLMHLAGLLLAAVSGFALGAG